MLKRILLLAATAATTMTDRNAFALATADVKQSNDRLLPELPLPAYNLPPADLAALQMQMDLLPDTEETPELSAQNPINYYEQGKVFFKKINPNKDDPKIDYQKELELAENALDNFRKALALDPENENYRAWVNKANRECGALYYHVGRTTDLPAKEKINLLFKSTESLPTLPHNAPHAEAKLLAFRAAALAEHATQHIQGAGNTNDPAQKQFHLNQAEKSLNAAQRDFEQLIAYQPRNLFFKLRHAQINALQGDRLSYAAQPSDGKAIFLNGVQGATQTIHAALEEYNQLPLLHSNLDTDVALGKASCYYKLGMMYGVQAKNTSPDSASFLAKAIEHCKKAIEIYNDALKNPIKPEIKADIDSKIDECKRFINNQLSASQILQYAQRALILVMIGLLGHRYYRNNAVRNEDKSEPANTNTSRTRKRNPRVERTPLDYKPWTPTTITQPTDDDASIALTNQNFTTNQSPTSVTCNTTSTDTHTELPTSKRERKKKRQQRQAHRKRALGTTNKEKTPTPTTAPVLPVETPKREQYTGKRAFGTTNTDNDLSSDKDNTPLKEKTPTPTTAPTLPVETPEPEQYTGKKAELIAKRRAAEQRVLRELAPTRTDEYKTNLRSVLAQRVKEVEARVGFAPAGTSSSTQVDAKTKPESAPAATIISSTQQEIGSATETKGYNPNTTSILRNLIPSSKTILSQYDPLKVEIVHELPQTFLPVAKILCELQEKTGHRFYLCGGSARKFLLANHKKLAHHQVFLNDLDVLSSGEYNSLRTHLTSLSAGYTLQSNPKGQDKHYPHKFYSDLYIKGKRTLTICHNSKISAGVDITEANERDLTFSALFVEFIKIDDNTYKAIIHDPSQQGIIHLLQNPPLATFIADTKEVTTKIINDPVQIIRLFYHAAQLNGKIPEKDIQLIDTILKENPKLLKDEEKVLNKWIEKIKTLPNYQRQRVIGDLLKPSIVSALPNPIGKKLRKLNKQFTPRTANPAFAAPRIPAPPPINASTNNALDYSKLCNKR